jgi:hypothetical protein
MVIPFKVNNRGRREQQLRALENLITTEEKSIYEALKKDLGKAYQEGIKLKTDKIFSLLK